MKFSPWLAAPVALLVLAGPAAAHTGHDHAATFAAGALHPVTGADHLAAMLAVGLLAALKGGRALWAWPAAFVAALTVGYGLAAGGIALPLVEQTILASVAVLLLMTLIAARTPAWAGAVVIGLFGVAHGAAHGAEAPAGAALAFPIGMALASAGLHALGAFTGLAFLRRRRAPARAS